MDIKKAIWWQETFKKTYKNSPDKIVKEVCDACDMAIEAIKLMDNKNNKEYK